MSWSAGTEPKHVAWHRLEKAGLWSEFQKTKKLLMKKPISMTPALAFKEALRRYPPPTATAKQQEVAEELRQADANIATGKIELHLDAEDEELSAGPPLESDEPPMDDESADEESEFASDLEELAELTKSLPVDSDRDIEFAYRNMGLKNLAPGMFPSVPSWRWYCYARQHTAKFLEKYADRADKRRKEASAGVEKFSDDKRQQLATIDKLAAAIRVDVEKTLLELKSQHPFEFDAAIRKAGYIAKPVENAA